MLRTILEGAETRADWAADREGELRAEAADGPPARPFATALTENGLAVIAEIKRRSPSAGTLAAGLDPATTAAAYEAGGAACLSVLTEPDHFSGSADDLRAARAAVSLPVLRKDFMVHPAQVWEARAMGADAVLLIVAAVSDGRLRALLAAAADAGMDALVEAHDELEVDRALRADAELIGVNNRDLATFRTDPAVAERLANLFPADRVRVAESGVTDGAVAARMHAAGYDAVLVGEALVRSADPASVLREIRGAR